jgi:tRNA (cytidine/uridine-2'-O-)-methyltransferase
VAPALLNVVLVRPQIPQNTGSIARLTAAVQARLHLVGPLGFSLEDRYLKRAGLDYWPLVDLCTYGAWEELTRRFGESRMKFFSARSKNSYLHARFETGDFLVFGSETGGLGAPFLAARAAQTYAVPIFTPAVRSLNLANAVAVVVYEALRQLGRLEP